MNNNRYHKKNKKAWNEAAADYQLGLKQSIEFLKNGGKNFCPPEYIYLKDLDKWCNTAIHLQCAGGTDTLSLLNHGAKEVIGIDISDKMIEVAKNKTHELGANARWFCCDVLSPPKELFNSADLIYTGKGALPWIMNIKEWAKVVTKLLKPNGKLYLYEGHPMTWLFDTTATDLVITEETVPYLDESIQQEEGWAESYIKNQESLPNEQSPKYEKNWNFSSIINSLIDEGMVLERFEEHRDEYWSEFPNLSSELKCKIAHTFSILMVKCE